MNEYPQQQFQPNIEAQPWQPNYSQSTNENQFSGY